MLNLLSVLILNQTAFLNFLWDLKLIVDGWLRGQLIGLRDIPLILIKLRVRLILLNQFLSLFLGLLSCLLFIFEFVKQIRVFLLFSQASQSILEFIVNIKSFFLFFLYILDFFSLLFLLCISLLLVFVVWNLGSWLNMLPLIKIVNHWAWVQSEAFILSFLVAGLFLLFYSWGCVLVPSTLLLDWRLLRLLLHLLHFHSL